MELQLKQQKLLDAKKNTDGGRSPMGGRSPTAGRSPKSSRSEVHAPGGSNVMSSILFSGINQP